MRWLMYLIFILLSIALVLFLLDPAPSLSKLWFGWDASSLNLLQSVTQRYLSPVLWDSAIVPLLKQQPWYTPTIIAGFLAIPYFLYRLFRSPK